MGVIRVARSELRKQMREQQRLRMLTLMAVVITVLGALPLFLMVRAATKDPVFTSLNALEVPAWAAGATNDEVSGSRWCVLECRYRERDVSSTKSPDETNAVYLKALEGAGWVRWKVANCPPAQGVSGHYTCWRRDEYTLDMWVRDKPCTNELLANRPTTGPDPSGSAAPAEDCKGSLVSFKVYNAIADDRLTDPSQGGSPPAGGDAAPAGDSIP
jgi:integrin beta 3